MAIPFRRGTDHVVCDDCEYSYPIAEVRAAVADAEVDGADEQADDRAGADDAQANDAG